MSSSDLYWLAVDLRSESEMKGLLTSAKLSYCKSSLMLVSATIRQQLNSKTTTVQQGES